MKRILEVQKQLIPDLLDVMKKRYTILHYIMISGVIGRRSLAVSLNLTERVLRGEVEFLKSQGLLEIESNGMKITPAGQLMLDQMEPMIKEVFELTDLESQIRTAFGLSQVIIVPGDSDRSFFTKKELGRTAASILRKNVTNGDVISVTGGSTIAEVANHMSSSAPLKEAWFVPARGGLGESVELQANTVAALMAQRIGGQYRLLHVPDELGEEAYQSLLQEPSVKEIVSFVRNCRIVVHGIGDAMVMARRRKVGDATISALQEAGALAEAFGYYFDSKGDVVYKMLTLGLQLEDIQDTELVIGVAGGQSKGKAIAAVLKFGHEDILVTDEAAAHEIIKYAP
jgi:central glycolytic genes regulator